MIKAVIFDLDDTLISEKKYVESGFKHISSLLEKKLNGNHRDLYILMNRLFNENPNNVFNRLFDEYGFNYSQDDIIELIEEYRNHSPKINSYHDVVPCIKKLKDNQIKLGVITDGYANAQRQKLTAIKAFELFDEIVITDELGRDFWKPHPRAFEIMKKKLDVEYNEMIYIGDNPKKDFYINKIYPITTIRIHRGGIYQDTDYLEDIMETASFYSLDEFSLYFNQYIS